MKSTDKFLEVNRRGMLTALTVLPALPMLPVSAMAQTMTSEPLPSWNDTASNKAIVTFSSASRGKAPDFVPEAARIATFDNDGTLWAEQPIFPISSRALPCEGARSSAS